MSVIKQTPPPPPKPAKRRRGRPKAGEGIDWDMLRTVFITTNKTIQKIAEEYHVSRTLVQKHYSKEKWRKLREEYRADVDKEKQRLIKRNAILTAVEKVERVELLTEGALIQLAKKLTAPSIATVRCPHCAKQHEVSLPPVNVSVDDLVKLVKLTAYLKGDPEFVLKVENQRTLDMDLRSATPEQIRLLMKECLEEAAKYAIGDEG